MDKSAGRQRAAPDQWLLFLGVALGATLHIPETLALYRQHGRNAVGVKDAFRRTSRIDTFITYRDAANLRLVVLDGRIGALEAIVRRHDRFSSAAASALRVYEAYRDRIRLQTAVYSSTGLRTRLRAHATLLARGAYTRGVWTLGRLQVLDDLAAALLGPAGVAWVRRARTATSRRGRGRQSQSP